MRASAWTCSFVVGEPTEPDPPSVIWTLVRSPAGAAPREMGSTPATAVLIAMSRGRCPVTSVETPRTRGPVELGGRL